MCVTFEALKATFNKRYAAMHRASYPELYENKETTNAK